MPSEPLVGLYLECGQKGVEDPGSLGLTRLGDPEEAKASYSAKLAWSLPLKVARGNRSARQHTAVQESFVGRGRPQCCARA